MKALGIILALMFSSTAGAADRTVKERIDSGGETRTYYLFVPESALQKPAPLLVLLHGSGRVGRSLVDYWEPLARKEGIILAGPDAFMAIGWGMREDGPHFLHALIEGLKAKLNIDEKRVYLFGHSAGAIHSLAMAVLESEYFAAVAVHAGVLIPDVTPLISRAGRKIPIAIWVGTEDRFFPLAAVRATRDALNTQGFDTELTEMRGHTHAYYGRASEINKSVWTFLKKHRLQTDPKYQPYALPH